MSGLYIIYFLFIILQGAYGWSWQCKNNLCKRLLYPSDGQTTYSSLELCELVCANYVNLWPSPTGTVVFLKNTVKVNPRDVNIHINGPVETETFLTENINYFKENLKLKEISECQGTTYGLNISLQPVSNNLDLNLNTNESYDLQISLIENKVIVRIGGLTVYGIRHAMETLLQLLVTFEENGSTCLATLSNIEIKDRPMYRHRALLLDTARNYLSVEVIKKNLDAMAASKLNVLHWHITDSQSFPLEAPRLPNMTRYGAYSRKQIYSASDIQNIAAYAKIRGVRILIEIDGPSHAGNGWQWGTEAGLGQLAVCVNQQPWRSFCIQPPCGQLNPINSKVYSVLQDLYADINDMLPNTDIFHMGGDEVFIPCWNNTQEIIDYINDKPRNEETFLNLWAMYHNKALAAYDAAVGHNNTLMIVWTSHLTEPDVIEKYLSKDRYIIHTWVVESNQQMVTELIDMGYKVILSTKDRWYLDHGFWGSTSYYNWKTVYENKIDYSSDLILGGEVCMWGELVDDYNIEPRIWPRAAAAAERLWSNPKTSANTAKNRFFAHTNRLERRGIHAEAVIPKWCVQNQGECQTYL